MQANRRANSPDYKGPPEVTRVVRLQPCDNHPQHTAAVSHDHGPDECAGVHMQPEISICALKTAALTHKTRVWSYAASAGSGRTLNCPNAQTNNDSFIL